MLTSRDDGRDREPRGSRGVGCPCHACRQTRRRVPPRGRAGRPHPPPVGALGEPSGRRTFVVLFVVLVDFAGAGRRFLVPSHEPLRKPLAVRGESPASHREWRCARLARRDEGEYRQYSTEKQRRQVGCSAIRMQRNCHHGLLAVRGRRGYSEIKDHAPVLPCCRVAGPPHDASDGSRGFGAQE